ncbi:helix-turn-helix domain-containing protein [Paraglaciecola sp.]|uniref:helix-turn-helix domain-containing protein n=1 Tax=Paraglaciecola sp. TaxID=1920173 RepID=UPI003EFAB324
MDRFILGERIKELRTQAGLTQESLGSQCNGWTKTRISNYESGERTPSNEHLFVISDVLKGYIGDDAIFYLLTGKNIPDYLADSNYKTPFVSFAPKDAVSILKNVLDSAVEFGLINTPDKSNVTNIISTYSKKCNDYINRQDNQKTV